MTRDQLIAVVRRLPLTADGVVIEDDMTIYYKDERGRVQPIEVGLYEYDMCHPEPLRDRIYYSTKELADASNTLRKD